MEKIVIIEIVVVAAVAVWAVITLKHARAQLRQIDLMAKQMEEDHGEFVAQHLAWRKANNA